MSNNKSAIATTIQNMCSQIIENINQLQLIANNVDSSGIIIDFDQSLEYINNIGKILENSKKWVTLKLRQKTTNW